MRVLDEDDSDLKLLKIVAEGLSRITNEDERLKIAAQLFEAVTLNSYHWFISFAQEEWLGDAVITFIATAVATLLGFRLVA